MEWYVKKDWIQKVLVITNEDNKKCKISPGYRRRMLTDNRIDHLLPIQIVRMDQKEYWQYMVGERTNLQDYIQDCNMKKPELECLLNSIYGVLENMEQYLLNVNSLLLQPQFIYKEVYRNSFSFCCYPYEERELSQQLCGLYDFVSNHLEVKDTDTIEYAYSAFRKITQI